MFDFGSFFEQVIAGIGGLLVGQLLTLISGLFSGLLG